MIDRNQAKEFAKSFSGMPYFPSEPEAMRALVDAIERCDDTEHAKRVVRDLQEDLDRAPQVSDIARAARATRSTQNAAPCDRCEGMGWFYPNPEVDAVKRCECKAVEVAS